MSIQTRSQARRYGETKHEDYLEQCFIDLGLPCKRRQVFCFLCLSMFTNTTTEYPDMCDHCGNTYLYKKKRERKMFCMPDLVVEDPQRHGKAVIFVNGKVHDEHKIVLKDKFQIGVLKRNGWRCFVIDNKEVDYLKHSNRCLLMLGIWAAMRDLSMYLKAYAGEKEIKALQ